MKKAKRKKEKKKKKKKRKKLGAQCLFHMIPKIMEGPCLAT